MKLIWFKGITDKMNVTMAQTSSYSSQKDLPQYFDQAMHQLETKSWVYI